MIRRPPTQISLRQSDVQELLQSRERGDGPVHESSAEQMPEEGMMDDSGAVGGDEEGQTREEREPTPNQSHSRDMTTNESFAEDSMMMLGGGSAGARGSGVAYRQMQQQQRQQQPLSMHERILGRGRGL